ncbi:MAG: UbiA-like protein EboC [Burkholderiales bacterium]
MLRAYLELLRPPNIATALGDVLAGFAIAGLAPRAALPWLLSSTACLYAGGIVLNDVFDRELDRLERPERPLPSGRVAVGSAATLGSVLLLAGIACAFQATRAAGLMAVAIAVAVLIYDSRGKRHAAIAPINMGLCRALNLLLGVAAAPAALAWAWPLGLIPLAYIGGITTLSRGEVHGGARGAATVALISLSFAWVALVAVALRSGSNALPAVVLAAALGVRVIPAFWFARRTPTPALIRTAVRRGVLSLVILDATLGAAYAGPIYGAIVLAVGLLAGALARMFAVT